jgi:hypothetical protein
MSKIATSVTIVPLWPKAQAQVEFWGPPPQPAPPAPGEDYYEKNLFFRSSEIAPIASTHLNNYIITFSPSDLTNSPVLPHPARIFDNPLDYLPPPRLSRTII